MQAEPESDDQDVRIRPERPADRAAVGRLLTAAFGRPAVAELADALRRGVSGEPCGVSLVADRAGELVGHLQLSRSWVDAAERLVPVEVLSPLGVLPRYQRQGIGGRLVRAALADAERRQVPLVFLEGSPSYYSRFGFGAASRHGFSPPSVRIPDAAFQVYPFAGWQPWMVGALVYAEAFWVWDCVGRRERD